MMEYQEHAGSAMGDLGAQEQRAFVFATNAYALVIVKAPQDYASLAMRTQRITHRVAFALTTSP